MEWDEFLEMMIKSRDMARNEKSTGLEHWLDSWLPKLAQMRLVAKQERAEVDKAKAEAKGRRSRRNSVDSANGSDGSAASLALSAAVPDAVKRLAEPRTLSEGEVRELRAAFELIDDDKSGRLDGGEIIDALNAEKVDVDEDAVVQMCVEAGSEDGEISLEQFLWYVAMRAPPNSKNKRKARGRAKVIQRDWWWRWLFPVWKSTSGMDASSKTSNLSISVKSKSFRLIFGRTVFSHRVLEAQLKDSRQNCRIRAH